VALATLNNLLLLVLDISPFRFSLLDGICFEASHTEHGYLLVGIVVEPSK
jgi:hypothetical protein